ncbi:MAG: hypothetical protein ACREJC_04605, partial [Tepidisphaeraceae bacterium]
AQVRIDASTTGHIAWRNLLIGTNAHGPESTDQVWTAPRAVSAANVTSASGESERFLFYRGVGNLDSPLRVARIGEALELHCAFGDGSTALRLEHVWLYEMRPDGQCAFVRAGPIELSDRARPRTLRGNFGESDFATSHLDSMKRELRHALVSSGLFRDEADALLNTWESSYFKGVGMRVLFLVPTEWTNRVLPLKLSVPATVTRVMVGRVDLLTPTQRDLIRTVATTDDPRLRQNAFSLLGRFGAALMLDEQRARPNQSLAKFLEDRGIPARPAPLTPLP